VNGAPRFFVLGAGRSGTSILQSLLSMHARLVVSHELRVLELAVLTGALFDNAGEPNIDERAPRTPAGLALGVRFVELLGEEQLRAADKPEGVYSDKYPPYCEQLAHLDRLWPQAKFVHILRDGRDVVASAIQAFITDRGWRRQAETPTVEQLATHWARQVRAARAYAARLPRERYLEISYEELTRDAANVLDIVLRFVGLEPDASHTAMAKRMRPGKTWRDTASHLELVQFESVADASALNRELGYPPTPLRPSDPGADATQSSWSATLTSPAQWADAGLAARARGDEKRAAFCFTRAIRGKSKDPRGAVALLEQSASGEALFAAMNARGWSDEHSRAALAAWLQARGLDAATARSVMGFHAEHKR